MEEALLDEILFTVRDFVGQHIYFFLLNNGKLSKLDNLCPKVIQNHLTLNVGS